MVRGTALNAGHCVSLAARLREHKLETFVNTHAYVLPPHRVGHLRVLTRWSAWCRVLVAVAVVILWQMCKGKIGGVPGGGAGIETSVDAFGSNRGVAEHRRSRLQQW